MTMSAHRRSRFFAALALALLLVVALPACGGNGNGAAEAPVDEEPPPTDSPPIDEELGGERFTADQFQPTVSFDVPQGWQAFETDGTLVQTFEGANQDRGISFDGSFREMSVEETVAQLREAEGFQTGETTQTTVGGASGEMFEGDVQQETVFEGAAYMPFPGVHIQVHVVDVEGETVVVFVDAPEDVFEEFVGQARPVLESVEFGGAGAGGGG
jgi:hypothetical protein